MNLFEKIDAVLKHTELNFFAESNYNYTTKSGKLKKAVIFKFDCKDVENAKKIAKKLDIELMSYHPQYAPERKYYCFIIK